MRRRNGLCSPVAGFSLYKIRMDFDLGLLEPNTGGCDLGSGWVNIGLVGLSRREFEFSS